MSELAPSLTHDRVSFEVDHLDEALAEGWSVLVRGNGHVVADPAELEQARRLPITPWAAGDRDLYVRIVPCRDHRPSYPAAHHRLGRFGLIPALADRHPMETRAASGVQATAELGVDLGHRRSPRAPRPSIRVPAVRPRRPWFPSVQHHAMVSPSAPQSRLVHPRTVATSVPSSPGSQSTLIGSCQQTEGLKSMGDSSESRAARCRAQPAPPSNPARLRKMQAPSTTLVLVRSHHRRSRRRRMRRGARTAPDPRCLPRRRSAVPPLRRPARRRSSNSRGRAQAAGRGRIPRQPRPQMQVQFEVRKESSKRQVVSPSVISVIDRVHARSA